MDSGCLFLFEKRRDLMYSVCDCDCVLESCVCLFCMG